MLRLHAPGSTKRMRTLLNTIQKMTNSLRSDSVIFCINAKSYTPSTSTGTYRVAYSSYLQPVFTYLPAL